MSKSKSHKRRSRVPVESKAAPTVPSLWGLDDFLARNTIAGPTITAETAMRCPAVACAVSLIADTVGNLPVKLYVRDDNGGKQPDAEHPAYALVHDDASPSSSASALRTQLTTDALLHGDGFAFANRPNDRVVEFNRLDPRAVTILTNEFTGEPSFRVSGRTEQRIYAADEILHIPAFSIDGIKGTSPIHQAREAIALTLVLEQHAARLFANGGRPSGILTTSENLGPDGAKNVSDSWHAGHGGQNVFKTAVLEGGMTFQQMALSSVDAQFMELRSFQIVEIARAFRVPPNMLFEMGRATWGNSEQMGALFLQLTLLPWLRTWTDAYSRLLLDPEERRSHVVDFVIDDLLRADAATRATAYAQYRAMGVMKANEVRAGLNLPAVPEGDSLDNPNITTAPTAGTAPEALAA